LSTERARAEGSKRERRGKHRKKKSRGSILQGDEISEKARTQLHTCEDVYVVMYVKRMIDNV
jgi:hypothetical protein